MQRAGTALISDKMGLEACFRGEKRVFWVFKASSVLGKGAVFDFLAHDYT